MTQIKYIKIENNGIPSDPILHREQETAEHDEIYDKLIIRLSNIPISKLTLFKNKEKRKI